MAARRLVTALLLGPPAWADTTASVLALEGQDAPADIVAQMTLALRLGLADAPGYQAVPGKDLVEMRLIFCPDEESAECMTRAAKSIGAAQLLYGVVTRNAQGYTVTVRLLDAPSRTYKATAQEQLPPAVTPQDVETAATRILGRLVGLPVPASLRVVCEPAGARLSIDGVDIGYVGEGGRLVQQVAPGARRIRLAQEGYVAYDQAVQVTGGERNDLRVVLRPEEALRPREGSETAPAPPASRRAWRIASWISLGLAVASGTAALVAGFKTQSLEDDKQKEIAASRIGRGETDPGYVNAGPDDDACAEADREGVDALASVCDRGRRMATITNILFGTAGAAALAWGASFHMGYLRVEAEPSGAVVVAHVRF